MPSSVHSRNYSLFLTNTVSKFHTYCIHCALWCKMPLSTQFNKMAEFLIFFFSCKWCPHSLCEFHCGKVVYISSTTSMLLVSNWRLLWCNKFEERNWGHSSRISGWTSAFLVYSFSLMWCLCFCSSKSCEVMPCKSGVVKLGMLRIPFSTTDKASYNARSTSGHHSTCHFHCRHFDMLQQQNL